MLCAMQISTATMIASQTTTTPRAGEQSAEFAPLMFKKAASAAVQSPATAPAQPAPAATNASVAVPQVSENPGSGYVRPGTNLDIKV